jgi:hypothetical protein
MHQQNAKKCGQSNSVKRNPEFTCNRTILSPDVNVHIHIQKGT